MATLAARGFTNVEIARQLYVTRRTVETHLTHVFQKLGVTGRAGLIKDPGLNEPGPIGSGTRQGAGVAGE